MKLLTAVALVLVALPAGAQRGGSRGGSSGHAASSFHAGYSAPHIAVAQHYASSIRSSSSYRPVAGPGHGGGSTLRYRRPYRSVYAVPAFYAPGVLSYDAGIGYDSGYPAEAYAQPYPDEVQPNYGTEAPPDQGQYGPAIPYPAPPPYPAVPAPMAAPASEDAVTLVYKDGRPNEQVHNYALTRTTLFVLDQHRREISLTDLDVPATVKVNHDAGVDFQLPGATH